ncbi:MAG: type IV pilus assembly protein PilM [Limisphaerales bacterium]
MLNIKSFLSFDFGAGSLKVAEFELTEDGGLRLKQFGVKPFGIEGTQEAAREGAILKGIQALQTERGLSARNINVCAPGFHVFSKFVKLPPVDTSKVTQIIQYEAQQNVPFPLEEVVWDYQILGTMPTGELEVLLVAIKADVVEGLFRTAEAAGLRLQLVDVSPAALHNAFRYNYGDLEGCTLLLDIGAKTSNLLFFEKGRFYSRGINIGANAITQDFATEARLSFTEAEAFKINEGFVSLGGAYEEPENPQQAQISKIARQVMTRLHIQVNQTIQFYRGQQGGAAPQRLFLAGGASLMPYTSQFFAEKLNLPVDYFNPFRNVQIDPSINLEELARVAHSLGEVVGLGLRNSAQCPVELNLMPKSILKRQQLNLKKPYFIAAVLSLVLTVFSIGWFYDKVTNVKQEALGQIEEKVKPLQKKSTELKEAIRARDSTKADLDKLKVVMEDRFAWVDLLKELCDVMQATEARTSAQLRVKTGIWIERFQPTSPDSDQGALGEEDNPDENENRQRSMMMMMMRYMGKFMKPEALRGGMIPGMGGPMQPTAPGQSAAAQKMATNEVSQIQLTCVAVNLRPYNPGANDNLIFNLQTEFNARSSYFDTNGMKFPTSVPVPEGDQPTIRFDVTVQLKHPIKSSM